MGYKRSVYITAARRMEQRRRKAESEAAQRHDAAVLKVPQLLQLENDMAGFAAQAARLIGSGENTAGHIESLKLKSLQTQQRRRELLLKAGLEPDWLEEKYFCQRCRDTGFVEGVMCRCYSDLICQTALEQVGAGQLIYKMTFDSFSVDRYPDELDEELGASCHEQMRAVYEYCRAWAEDFSKKSNGIIMLGKTGLGKTHLSVAAAATVTKKGYDVFYGSMQSIMHRLEREHFAAGRSGDEDSLLDELLLADLLILDDLGTEFTTQFTISRLYNIINSRLIDSKPIIFSTNLTMSEIEAKYSQRVASRIVGSCVPLRFCGADQRQ